MNTAPSSSVTGTVGNLASIEAALVELRQLPKGIVGDALRGMTVILIVNPEGASNGKAATTKLNGRPAPVAAPSGQTAKLREIRAWAGKFRGFSTAQLREQFTLNAPSAQELIAILQAEGFIGKHQPTIGYPVVGGAGRPLATTTAARRAPGQKRTQEEISGYMDVLRRGIKAYPGRNISALKKLLPGLAGCTTEDLKLPMEKLYTEGAYYSVGERRGTKYWPQGQGPEAKGAKGAAKPPTAAKPSPKKTKATKPAKAKPAKAKPAKAKPAKATPKKATPKKASGGKKKAPAKAAAAEAPTA